MKDEKTKKKLIDLCDKAIELLKESDDPLFIIDAVSRLSCIYDSLECIEDEYSTSLDTVQSNLAKATNELVKDVETELNVVKLDDGTQTEKTVLVLKGY